MKGIKSFSLERWQVRFAQIAGAPSLRAYQQGFVKSDRRGLLNVR